MDNLIAINALVALGAALLGYLFGSIPNGVIVGRLLFHKDPREFGSKNSGGTNVARTMGRRYGVLVIFLDMLKALAPIFVTWAILTFTPLEQYMHWGAQVGYTTIGGAKTWYWLAGLFAAIGHCWPLYIRFKGGKAVASLHGHQLRDVLDSIRHVRDQLFPVGRENEIHLPHFHCSFHLRNRGRLADLPPAMHGQLRLRHPALEPLGRSRSSPTEWNTRSS